MRISKTINKIRGPVKKLELILFFASLFLLKLPPFYIFFRSQFLTNHSISKIIIALLIVVQILSNNYSVKRRGWIFSAVFLYFVFQSTSILNAENIVFFWKRYQTIISSIFLFYLTFILMGKDTFYKKTEKFIYFTGIFILLFEFTLFLFPGLFRILIKYFFQKEIAELYLYNLNQGKYNLYLSSELFLPFFIWEMSKRLQNNQKGRAIFNLLPIYLLFFLTFTSQFRTRLLQLLLASVLSIWQFWLRKKTDSEKNIKANYKEKILLFVTIFALFILLVKSSGMNVARRILLTDAEDKKTVIYRLTGMIRSYEFFLKSPVFGVGLGNYKYYIDNTNTGTKIDSESEHSRITLEDPHSIISETLAETGILGLFFFLLMIFGFFLDDKKWLFGQRNDFIVCCIISSWTIMIRGLVSPVNTLYLIGWFWFLRGVISSRTHKVTKLSQ